MCIPDAIRLRSSVCPKDLGYTDSSPTLDIQLKHTFQEGQVHEATFGNFSTVKVNNLKIIRWSSSFGVNQAMLRTFL